MEKEEKEKRGKMRGEGGERKGRRGIEEERDGGGQGSRDALQNIHPVSAA